MSEEQAVTTESAPVALPELKINFASDGKQEIRNKIWDYMADNKLSTFPWPPHKRIPNFKGAEEAGVKAITMDTLSKASLIKVDTDRPLQEARVKAMEDKKTVLVPTPRLRYGFLNKIVPPEDADKRMLKICSTRQGFDEYSKPVDIEEKIHVDVVAVGSVAVSSKGWKLGKGEGFSDLEYAILAELGLVDANTQVITVVHDAQVIDLPDGIFGKHDVPVDYIVTPTRVIKAENRPARPVGIIWSLLDEEKVKAIPILGKLRFRAWKAGKDVKLSGETEAPKELEDVEVKMEDDPDRKPRPRRPYRRRGFGGRGRRGGSRQGGGDREETTDGEGDADRKVNGSRRGGYRSGYRRGGGWGRRGRGGGRRGGSRGDGERVKRESENEGGYSGDEKPARRGGGGGGYRSGRRFFRPRRGFDEYEGSVFVGSLPRSLRVSDFKGEVRDRKVNPLRVMWRGSSGFAFLNFKTKDEAEEALTLLEGLSFNERAPRVEMAKERERSSGGSRRRRQRADSEGGDDEEGGDN